MLKFALRRYMDSENLTIQNVADRTGISRTTISAFYNEKSQGIQFDTLNKLVLGLGVDPWDLFDDKFNADGLSITVDPRSSVEGWPTSEDEPSFDAYFFQRDDEQEGVRVSQLHMPLYVDTVKSGETSMLTIFLSYDVLGDEGIPESQQYSLMDFLTRTEEKQLETYLIDVSTKVFQLVIDAQPSLDPSFVVFRTDVGTYSATKGDFLLIKAWPVEILDSGIKSQEYLDAKYTGTHW